MQLTTRAATRKRVGRPSRWTSVPVAMGRGDGSASRASLATVVVGGQILCLLVTLIVTPVIYSMFDDLSGLRVFSAIRFPRVLRRRGFIPGGEKVPARP